MCQQRHVSVSTRTLHRILPVRVSRVQAPRVSRACGAGKPRSCSPSLLVLSSSTVPACPPRSLSFSPLPSANPTHDALFKPGQRTTHLDLFEDLERNPR